VLARLAESHRASAQLASIHRVLSSQLDRTFAAICYGLIAVNLGTLPQIIG
jgi:hypothetical protein